MELFLNKITPNAQLPEELASSRISYINTRQEVQRSALIAFLTIFFSLISSAALLTRFANQVKNKRERLNRMNDLRNTKQTI
jgi:hypothetical protein